VQSCPGAGAAAPPGKSEVEENVVAVDAKSNGQGSIKDLRIRYPASAVDLLVCG
jgi:hypothetical protein